MAVGALVMVLVGAAYGVTHASEPVRRAGWMGEPGRLTVLGCDRERGSRGGTSYQCYGDFAADDRAADPKTVPAQLDDTSTSAYRLGQVLKVTFNGRGTVSPVGFGYTLHGLMALLFMCVSIPGLGVLLAGGAMARPEGRWHRVSTTMTMAGLAMFGGGIALAVVLGLISLF
jgi:hypothetical protein